MTSPRPRVAPPGLLADFPLAVFEVSTTPVPAEPDQYFRERFDSWLAALTKGKDGLDHLEATAFAVLAAIAQLNDKDKDHYKRVQTVISTLSSKDFWYLSNYETSYAEVPELAELTSTPFMLQIVTTILPNLESSKRSVTDIKTSLVLSLGNAVAEVVWALNGIKELIVNITEVRRALDGGGYRGSAAGIPKAATEAADRIAAMIIKRPRDAEWKMLPEGMLFFVEVN